MTAHKTEGFKGFSGKTLEFYPGLEKNNSNQWFQNNRGVYDEHVLVPAKQFILGMGEKLKELSPMINAYPRTNKSLFRINRAPGSAKTSMVK